MGYGLTGRMKKARGGCQRPAGLKIANSEKSNRPPRLHGRARCVNHFAVPIRDHLRRARQQCGVGFTSGDAALLFVEQDTKEFGLPPYRANSTPKQLGCARSAGPSFR